MRYMLLQNYGEVESDCPPMTEWTPYSLPETGGPGQIELRVSASPGHAGLRRTRDILVALPPGYTLLFSGQFEFWEKTIPRLVVAGTLTLFAIVVLLYVATQSWLRVGIVMLALSILGIIVTSGGNLLIGSSQAMKLETYGVDKTLSDGTLSSELRLRLTDSHKSFHRTGS